MKFILIETNSRLIDACKTFFSNEQNVTSLGSVNKTFKIDANLSPASTFKFPLDLWSALLVGFLISSCGLTDRGKYQVTDTAYVKQSLNSDSLSIKVYHKGRVMVHDPISVFTPRYYLDSMLFIVPGNVQRAISFENIRTFPAGGYPFVQGSIAFIVDSIRIYLLYNDYDHKKIDKCTWNKDYIVKWQ